MNAYWTGVRARSRPYSNYGRGKTPRIGCKRDLFLQNGGLQAGWWNSFCLILQDVNLAWFTITSVLFYLPWMSPLGERTLNTPLQIYLICEETTAWGIANYLCAQARVAPHPDPKEFRLSGSCPYIPAPVSERPRLGTPFTSSRIRPAFVIPGVSCVQTERWCVTLGLTL